jgi:hypothetical protein
MTGVPFVDLYIRDKQIPLLDTQAGGYLLKSFTYTMRTGTIGNIVQIELIDPEWTRFESLIITNVAERRFADRPKFSFQFGWRGVDTVKGQPYIQMSVLSWTMTLMPFGGSIIKLIGITDGVELSLHSMYKGFSEDTLISDAIIALCNDLHVVCKVDPTSTTVGLDNLMNGLTPTEYIKLLLKKAVSSSTKLSDMVMSTLVLPDGRTGIRISSLDPLTSDIKSFTVSRERDGECISFQPKYNGLLAAAFGSEDVKVIGYNPEAKSWIPSDCSDSVMEDLNRYISTSGIQFTPIERYDTGGIGPPVGILVPAFEPPPPPPPLPPYTPSRTWEVPYLNVGDVQAYADRKRILASLATYPAEATVMGDTTISPFNFIEFRVLKVGSGPLTPDDLHPTSGTYQVLQAAHTITPGSFRTDLQLLRRGLVKARSVASSTVKNTEVSLIPTRLPALTAHLGPAIP